MIAEIVSANFLRPVPQLSLWNCGLGGPIEAAALCRLRGLRVLAVALAPVMPKATAVLWESLGAAEAIGPLADQRIADAATWGQLPTGTAITKPASLFPRIEMDSVEAPDA